MSTSRSGSAQWVVWWMGWTWLDGMTAFSRSPNAFDLFNFPNWLLEKKINRRVGILR